MQKPVTLSDIARILKLSTSTVSRCLRNAPDVNIETKNAVISLAKELHYEPNRLALSLLNKHTNIIGVMVPNLDYVLSTMVKGIDEIALEAGYTVLVCQSNESYGRELVNTTRLLDSLVDGYLISVSSETKVFDHLKKIQTKNKPLVLFDRLATGLTGPRVRLNDEAGGRLAAQHLVEQGYKKIAILAGKENLEISNQRVEGFLQVLKRNHIKVDKAHIVHCDFNQDYAYLATKELLNTRKKPDAIFTISDRMAIGSMLAIKEKGLSMPEDIGLLGFNNEPITKLVTPNISSVELPAFEMGKVAAKLLIEVMNSEEDLSEREIVLEPKLFIRDSTKRK